MRKRTVVLILMFFLIILVGFSEIISFADDNIPYIMSINETVILEASEMQETMNSCIEPNLSNSSQSVVIKNALKDSDIKLAFVTSSGTVEISLEEYLIGVVISEVPYTFEFEAIKAQAVASRTYALRELESGSRHAKGVLCGDPSHCSAYMNRDNYINQYGESEYNKAHKIIKQAVNETDGVIITYDGKPCCAVYHSSSDGYTENSYNLWGTETPYLISVSSIENAHKSTVEISESKMNSTLSYYGKVGNNPGDIFIKYNNSGRCETLNINGVDISASKLRSVFGLKSCDFEINYTNGIYTFTVLGYGHGIGLSQYGANEMAKSGSIWSDILLHYYSGVKIEYLK